MFNQYYFELYHNDQSRSATTTAIQLTVKAVTTDNPQQHTMDRIIEKFPTVFNGQIKWWGEKNFIYYYIVAELYYVQEHHNQYICIIKKFKVYKGSRDHNEK